MGAISLLYKNILESATVTVNSENPLYPKERMFDRQIGRFFKSNNAPPSLVISVDQGTSTIFPVKTMIIAPNSIWQQSRIVFSYSEELSGFIEIWGSTGSFVEEAPSPLTYRYWEIRAFSQTDIAQISEIFIGNPLQLTNVVLYPYNSGRIGNVERYESRSGRPYFLEIGEEREYRNFLLRIKDADTMEDVQDFLTHSRHKPFWLKDMDGSWHFMSLVNPNIGAFTRQRKGVWEIQLEMMEVLA